MVPDHSQITDAMKAIAPIGEGEPHSDLETGVVSVGVGGRGSDALVEAVRALDAAGIVTRGLALRRPSLDDVFLALTGHAAEEDGLARETGKTGRRRRRGPRVGRPVNDEIARTAS
jgi:ABC-2 type transport system ATP-binding protein